MADAKRDYWSECIETTADEIELKLTTEQVEHFAGSVEAWHDNYGMAFYSPPSSDRVSQIESEWKAKYKALEREFEKYRDNAETAVKVALRQSSSTQVSIGEHGEVRRYDGRSDRIQ